MRVPGLVLGIAFILLKALGGLKSSDMLTYEVPNSIGSFIQLVVGMFLIGKSRKLSEFWFKHEDE